MPTIKPVSDLRNYGEVLRDVAIGHPVFLTRNGHGRYAILDMEEYQEYERMKAMRQLMGELEKGRGTQFDPNVVDVFLENWEEFKKEV